MPVTEINPNNSGTIKLGIAALPTTEYACQVQNFVINPVANSKPTSETFCRAAGTRKTKSSYEVSFSYLQDWGATDSISEFMQTNDGQLVYFEFSPEIDTVSGSSGAFWAGAGSYGGAPGDAWVSTGTCPMDGDPVYTPPVVSAAAASFAAGDDTES